MRVTSASSAARTGAGVQPPRRGWIAAVLVLLALIFEIDARTGASPFQHLYYLPIVLAGLRLGRYAAPAVAVAAVVLYHLANPILLTWRYGESDFVQIALFLGIGVVTAKLAGDARRFRRLAATDDLTGLYNLRGFEARLVPVIRAAREAGAPVSLLVLDVDRLKSLNDTHGHLTGADAVRTVGLLVAAHLPAAAFACRFGGDEFVVALPGQAASDANATAMALRQAVNAAAPVLAGKSFPAATLSISIGVACMSGPAGADPRGDVATGEALFREADRALYLAKAGGRNRIAVA